ncbi:MAG: bifunctional DNA primase/polymerase, partial [FCB group bacterium]|nr:bifunctional DNA primase/polymerase [FCB group bacterium]
MSSELLPTATPAERALILRLWNRDPGSTLLDDDEDHPLVAEVVKGHARGWSFTPLAGKRPTSPGWQRQPRATLDQVIEWAKRGNVGLRTGTASGVVVLDVDEAKGGRVPDGLPETVTVETGGGGLHFYFQALDGVDLGNSVGKIAPHVDVRGEGGQVVFPGSVHPETGAFYEWAECLSPDDVSLAPFPCVLLDLLRKQSERPAPAPTSPRATPSDLRNRYLEKALSEELDAVTSMPEGQRNDRLNRAAFSLGQLVGEGLNPEDTAELLLSAAMRAGLTESEARATIRSGLTDGQAHPRVIPEPSMRPTPSTRPSLGETGAADSAT